MIHKIKIRNKKEIVAGKVMIKILMDEWRKCGIKINKIDNHDLEYTYSVETETDRMSRFIDDLKHDLEGLYEIEVK